MPRKVTQESRKEYSIYTPLPTEEWRKLVGPRIKKARIEMGWTSARLSRASGVPPYSLSAFQSGTAGVSLGGILCLASALGISYDDLFSGIVSEEKFVEETRVVKII